MVMMLLSCLKMVMLFETFGDINVDGTGEPWEYGLWAYKLGPTVGAPGPTSFSGFDWSLEL